jgi:uncharacterized protein YdeI (YjbR/CyaY-like superfamily)
VGKTGCPRTTKKSLEILLRIQMVKRAKTRAQKTAEFVAMLEKHEKIHP